MFASGVLTISIIIPTLNEAENIESVVSELPVSTIDEVIVVDGGSEDETVCLAAKAGCRVFTSPERGRANQLNLGAEKSLGNVLLFFHADTYISSETLENLRELFEDDEWVIGGGFKRRFDSPSHWLGATCRLADWRGKAFGWFLGDQGIFVRREEFERLGGFDQEMKVGEDLDFSVRMSASGKTQIVGPPVLSSARRFSRTGPLRQTISDFRTGWGIVKRARRKNRK